MSSQKTPQQMGYPTKHRGLNQSSTSWASFRHPWDFQEPPAAHGYELWLLWPPLVTAVTSPGATSTSPPVAVAVGARKKGKIPTRALHGSHSNPSTQIMTLKQECCFLLPDEPHHGEWSERTGENTRQRREINRTEGFSISLQNHFLLCLAEDCCKTSLY